MPQDFEKSKPRRSDEQKNYDEADNAGRFAGNDKDANETQQGNTKRDTPDNSTEFKDVSFSDHTDVLAKRDGTQSKDYKGEAQNVNDDTGRPLNDDELEHARNKATEGLK